MNACECGPECVREDEMACTECGAHLPASDLTHLYPGVHDPDGFGRGHKTYDGFYCDPCADYKAESEFEASQPHPSLTAAQRNR